MSIWRSMGVREKVALLALTLVTGLVSPITPASADESATDVNVTAEPGISKTASAPKRAHIRTASKKVVPGKRFTFKVSGLRAGAHVYPFILLGSKNQCCGAGLSTIYSPRGKTLRVSFRWPIRFTSCRLAGGRECKSKEWKSGRVTVGLRHADVDGQATYLTGKAAASARVVIEARRTRSNRSAPRLMTDHRATSSTRARAASAPAITTIPPLHDCEGSRWMTNAGAAGSGEQFNVSFTPTGATRYLARSIPGAYNMIWSDLMTCQPFALDLTPDQRSSMFQQMMCHVLYGVGPLGGSTFDFEAFRPSVPATTYLDVASYRCNWPPSTSAGDKFIGRIIQSNADTSSQRAAWLITGSKGRPQRLWIETASVYSCLRGKGFDGPDQVAGLFIAEYLPEAPGKTASCSDVPIIHQPVNAYDNYGSANAGRAMCRGNPARPESMPGGTVRQSFTIGGQVATLSSATVQIDPDSRVSANLTLVLDGVPVASATSAASGDTNFSWSPVAVRSGQQATLQIYFTSSYGKIITVYTAGSPGGVFTTSNTCPDGAPSVTLSSTGLRAVVRGST